MNPVSQSRSEHSTINIRLKFVLMPLRFSVLELHAFMFRGYGYNIVLRDYNLH